MSILKLHRRGFSLGSVESRLANLNDQGDINAISDAWHQGKAFKLDSIASARLSTHALSIAESQALYKSILDETEFDTLLAQEPYESRLTSQFEALGSAFNEGNKQEIETVFFDGVDGATTVAEDLWVKVSWLSFTEGDGSLRFRFSFGVDFEEDVASDANRQHYSAELAEAIFQESKIVTAHLELIDLLEKTLQTKSIRFVERIIYFNAPNGGAYLHHDRERGHAGVVYAQLTGKTFWLALPRKVLVAEIQTFVNACNGGEISWPGSISGPMQKELLRLAENKSELKDELESFSNSTLIHLINETEGFVQTLIHNGFGTLMVPGDVLLLPQQSDDLCCWHSVFCIGEETGEALSFAIRAT